MDNGIDPSDNTIMPNFFCIGAKRCGTTWLYSVLKEHPQIYLCPYLKESNYFSENHFKGLNWYKSLFPKENGTVSYKAIGEIDPTYLFFEKAPIYLSNIVKDAHIIVILRDPVERFISSYKHHKLKLNLKEDISQFQINYPDSLERGFYSSQIKHWLEFFQKEQFLILIFEELMNDKLNTLKKVAKFLNIDFKFFTQIKLEEQVNPSKKPRLHLIYLIGYRIIKKLRALGLHKISTILKKVRPILYKLGQKEDEILDPYIKNELFMKYKDDIEELEKLINKDLTIWKKAFLNKTPQKSLHDKVYLKFTN